MAVLAQAQIAPSLLSADFLQLGREISSLEQAGCEVLHLDIMDGNYVPNISFGPLVVKAVRRQTDLQLEAHLMIAKPDDYLERFVTAGADTILIHASTCSDPGHSLATIRSLGARAGLVVNPDESLADVLSFADQLDQILIMSVFPGFGGQKFIPEVLEALPDLLPELTANNVLVEIDGGINAETLPHLQNQGIDRFVAGSAVFRAQTDTAENYQRLVQIINRV